MLKLINFFIDKPKIVNLILIFIIFAGVLALINVKKEGYPPADLGQVNITTTYEGASPKDVELKVTTKIEEKLKNVSGIKKIESWSIENFSNISIEMEDWVNIEKVNNDIKTAVDQVSDFPEGVKKPVVTLLELDSFPIEEIAITGEASYREKREYALALEKSLLKNKYVGQIQKVGYLDREIKIEVDKKKLIKNYISLGELITAIRDQNFRMSAGDLLDENNEKKFIVMSEFKKLKDVGDVIIRSGFEGKRVVVSDVSMINDGFETPESLIRYNGMDSINVIIIKKPKTDIIKTVKSIKTDIENFKEILPDNIHVNQIVDYSAEVKNLLNLALSNAWMGFFLVILVLILLLNYRLAFWIAMGIPTSIFIAFMLFPFFGININFISLMAMIIVLGMLVDDAIIVGENIFRYREIGLPSHKAAYTGTKEVMWPVVCTILTTIIVFLPMAFMTGIMGKFMRTMPMVIMLLLLASLIEALFILPSHVAHMKIKKEKIKTARFFEKFENLYEKFLIKVLKNKIKTIIIFFLILIIAFGLLASPIIKFIFFPSDDGLYGYIKFETKIGTSLEKTAGEAKKIEKLLLSMAERKVKKFDIFAFLGLKKKKIKLEKELSGFVTTIGEKTAEIMDFGEGTITGSFYGNIIIHLTPIKDRKRTSTEIMKDVKNKLKDIKGFKNLEADIVSDGPPVGKAVTVTFIHNNDNIRNNMARGLKKFLSKQDGISNIGDNEGEGKKQLIITFDYDEMSRLGIDPLTASNVIRTAFDGTVATSLKWEGEDINYRVILDKESRKSIKTLTSLATKKLEPLTVLNNSGKLIQIGRFISITESNDKMMINHHSGDRSITIFADLDTKKTTSQKINDLIKKEFTPKVKKIPGMAMIFGGEEQETVESMKSLKFAFIIAILGVYFILVILFNSFTQPFLVMLTIPFGLAGVIYAFLFQGIPFSFMALIGVVGLSGVVVNDSLVMISFLNNKRKENGLSIKSLANAARHRLRPIFLTTATTTAGLFPSAYGFGGDNPFIIPMIMAIAWGLIFATVITLILIPSVYLLQIEVNEKVQNFLEKLFIPKK